MGISTTPSLCTLSVQLQGTVEVHNTMMKIRDGNAKDLKIRLFFLGFLPASVENVRLCYLRLRAFRLSFAKPKLIRAKVSLTRNQSEHTWTLVNIFKRGKIQVTEFWLVEMVTRVFIKKTNAIIDFGHSTENCIIWNSGRKREFDSHVALNWNRVIHSGSK